jgi:hypothetical protein
VKPQHDQTERVLRALSQSNHIMLSKVPRDVLSDYDSIKSNQVHFKAGISMLQQAETSLQFEDDYQA